MQRFSDFEYPFNTVLAISVAYLLGTIAVLKACLRPVSKC